MSIFAGGGNPLTWHNFYKSTFSVDDHPSSLLFKFDVGDRRAGFATYHDSHMNSGNIMGSWVGREGKGLQLWSTYWLAPQSTIRMGYRSGRVASDFVPGGGSLDDVSTRADLLVRPDLSLGLGFQCERWKVPLLLPGSVSNVTASFQLTYRPTWKTGKHGSRP